MYARPQVVPIFVTSTGLPYFVYLHGFMLTIAPSFTDALVVGTRRHHSRRGEGGGGGGYVGFGGSADRAAGSYNQEIWGLTLHQHQSKKAVPSVQTLSDHRLTLNQQGIGETGTEWTTFCTFFKKFF